MRSFGQIFLGLLLVWGCLPQTISSDTITLVNYQGEKTEVEIKATDKFLDVLAWIQSYLQAENAALDESQFDFSVSRAGIAVRAKKLGRDYDAGYSKQDKNDITFIVTTLQENLITIGLETSKINKAGDRLEHLHPFCFLDCILSNERLKAGMHAIRERKGMVWDKFRAGITKSLAKEASHENLLQYTESFAKNLNLNSKLIKPSLQQGKYDEFVYILLDNLPREGNPNRYDM